MQRGSMLDANGKRAAISGRQNRTHVAKGQGECEPGHQAVKRQQPEQDKERYRQIASQQQKSVKANKIPWSALLLLARVLGIAFAIYL